MEPCFIWQDGCSKGDQYAAWAQAVFSVVAIVFSGWLARSAERQRIADNNKLVQIYAFEVISTLQLMIHLADIGNAPEWNRHAKKMQHAIDASNRIDPGLLPYSAAVAITTIKEEAMHINDRSPITYDVQFNLLKAEAERAYNATSEAGKTISEALRKQKWWKRNREEI